MSSSSGVKNQAFANTGTGQAENSQLYGQAGNIYGSLAPELATEAAHPTGLTPAQKAAQNTAAQQSAGGSQAATVGQGALLAARTKNAGTADAAIAQGSRGAGQNLSQAALGTEQQDAALQQRNQQAGISGMENLYGTDLGASNQALGLSNQALGVANGAKPTFWQNLAGQAGGDILKNAESGVGF